MPIVEMVFGILRLNDYVMSWMIEIRMIILLVSDTICNIVNL